MDPVNTGKGLDRVIAEALFDSSLHLPHIVLSSSPEDLYYHGTANAKVTADFTKPLSVPPPTLVSPSSLLHITDHNEEPAYDGAVNTGGMVYGSAVHEALSSIIRRHATMPAEFVSAEIVRVLSMHDLDRNVALDAVLEILALLKHPLIERYSEQLASSRIETMLVGALHGVVFQGILDVRMHTTESTIEVWDWKTNRVASQEHLESVAATYTIQMCTYAWLCLRAYPAYSTVVTRLVFTKAAGKGLTTIDYSRTWQRAEMELMEATMMQAVSAHQRGVVAT
ncbi:MAG: PD-(D/E)XK nuclease family protein, partial [Candidatus Kapabacteria bacterium]|nr:PD-(D/E)XK nuclease family protein [Candidatus Kapabacteria bacterium]